MYCMPCVAISFQEALQSERPRANMKRSTGPAANCFTPVLLFITDISVIPFETKGGCYQIQQNNLGLDCKHRKQSSNQNFISSNITRNKILLCRCPNARAHKMAECTAPRKAWSTLLLSVKNGIKISVSKPKPGTRVITQKKLSGKIFLHSPRYNVDVTE